MSVDPRRTGMICSNPRCYRECRCSRWPDYKDRWGNYVVPHDEDTYADKVLSYGPIAYWPLWETAGAVAECQVNPLQNGTAVGVTWNNAVGPDGVNGAPFFDGANDYINIFTAAFDAAFNGATGSMMIWCRVFNAGVWTDGANRRAMQIYDDANNRYLINKNSANNTENGAGVAGAGICNDLVNPYSNTAWYHAASTWSDGAHADEFRHFLDGAQQGAACATMNVWGGGGLDNTRTLIGCDNTVGPASVYHGWLAHCAVWDTVLTPAQIADLATV